MSGLSRLDCELLLESLEFSELAVRQYQHYPEGYDRQERIGYIQEVKRKVRMIRKDSGAPT